MWYIWTCSFLSQFKFWKFWAYLHEKWEGKNEHVGSENGSGRERGKTKNIFFPLFQLLTWSHMVHTGKINYTFTSWYWNVHWLVCLSIFFYVYFERMLINPLSQFNVQCMPSAVQCLNLCITYTTGSMMKCFLLYDSRNSVVSCHLWIVFKTACNQFKLIEEKDRYITPCTWGVSCWELKCRLEATWTC